MFLFSAGVIFLKVYFYFMYVILLAYIYACMCVCVHTCAHATHRSQKRAPNTLELELWITIKLSYGCSEMNPGPLQDLEVQQVFLVAESSL